MQYFFDHIFFKAFYPSPNMHKHFAKHMIFALDGCLHCKINQDECTCRGIVIQSNCMHTVLSDKTPILVYLFDETCKRAECLNELYLKGADYAVVPDALCDDVCTIVNEKVTEKKNGTEDDEKRVLQSCTDEKILKICGLERGGMLAPRAAAFEKRIERVIAWSVFPSFTDILLSSLPAGCRRMLQLCLRLKLKGLLNAALKNVRSLTFRLFTEAESASNHCNCGNTRLVLDYFIQWIEGIKASADLKADF